jgi:hypothetical protein
MSTHGECAIVTAMSTTASQPHRLDPQEVDEQVVRAWRAEQLGRLGLPRSMADMFADMVDWHDLAVLVGRGCPPRLALRILL